MIRIDQIKIPIKENQTEALTRRVSRLLRVRELGDSDIRILRRSIDARDRGEIFFVYSVAVDREPASKRGLKNISPYEKKEFLPITGISHMRRPVVVGAGPAGLFAAYYLALCGHPPLLIERGRPVEKRAEDVARFWETGILDTASNVQFGEGGAGTFSDGKLNTLIKDRDGSMSFVLETFVRFGADPCILYDYKPHIGTDVLIAVIKNMREELIRLGCEIRFETVLLDIYYEADTLKSVLVSGATGEERVECEDLILAIGHSARDTFYKLRDRGIPMQAKEFAVGLRIEHKREFIDTHQFGKEGAAILGAAPYKLAAKLKNGRGVYSFCMCPGGFVVNSSSEEGRLVVNGMSYSKRDGDNSNSAIVVSVGRDEYDMSDPLSGVEYQRRLESRAFCIGGGRIPQQLFSDFKGKRASVTYGSFPSMTRGEAVLCDLSPLFSDAIRLSFLEGMEEFDKKLRGFSAEDAILSGIESRTSSPVRIPRDASYQSMIRGFYPCGEGAGYAGGITSAAMDGLHCAKAVIENRCLL